MKLKMNIKLFKKIQHSNIILSWKFKLEKNIYSPSENQMTITSMCEKGFYSKLI